MWAYEKLPKWLRKICITKKCVFNNLKKITHYYNNGFEENIYIYILYIYKTFYSFLYFYVLCFLLVLPFIYLLQVYNLTLARCFLLALKLWRKSEIIEFVHKIWRCFLWESAKDGSPKRASKKDWHEKVG